MQRIACLVLAVVASTAHAESPSSQLAERTAPKPNQLRADVAFSGPGGMMALRYSRMLSTGMRIEPAVGLAYTGLLISALVAQPITSWDRRTSGGTAYTTALELYGGYGASVLRDGLHHPWAGSPNHIPDGTYHWVDFGLSTMTRLRSWVFGMGTGASILVKAPDSLGAEMREDDYLWPLFPEGWMTKQHWVPTLWTSMGYEF